MSCEGEIGGLGEIDLTTAVSAWYKLLSQSGFLGSGGVNLWLPGISFCHEVWIFVTKCCDRTVDEIRLESQANFDQNQFCHKVHRVILRARFRSASPALQYKNCGYIVRIVSPYLDVVEGSLGRPVVGVGFIKR